MNYELSDLDDLTPGAVFIREDGSKRFVLFLANATLTGKKAKRFPSRVVFANERFNVFDVDLDSFFRGCKFHNVEPDLENKLESLFVFKDSDDLLLDNAVAAAQVLNVEEKNQEIINFEDTEDVEEVMVASIEEAEELLASAESDFLTPEVVYPISFFKEPVENNPNSPVVPAELLSAMVTGYQQEPQISTGFMLHKITFSLPANITSEQVKQCFDVGKERSNAIYPYFELNNTDFGSDARTIDWSHSIGGYPEYVNGKVNLQIVLAESITEVEDFVEEATNYLAVNNINEQEQQVTDYDQINIVVDTEEVVETQTPVYATDITYLPSAAINVAEPVVKENDDDEEPVIADIDANFSNVNADKVSPTVLNY